MPCTNITGPFVRGCDNVSAGIKRLWVANYSVNTVWSSSTIGSTVDQIVSGGTNIPTFYKVDIRPGTNEFIEETEGNEQWGSRSIKQTLTCAIIGQSQSGRTFMNKILNGQCVFAVETMAGEYILAGEEAALEATGGRASAGVQRGDPNNIVLNLTATASEFAPTISSVYASYILT